MKKKSLFIYALIAILVALFVFVYYAGKSNELILLKERVEDVTVFSSSYFKTFESQDTKALSATLDSILQDPGFKEVFLKKDSNALYQYGEALFQKLKTGYGITHFYFMLPDGTIFLRLHNQAVKGDLNNRVTFRQAVESKSVGSGIELGKTAFALRVVKPYYDNNKLIGYIELGQEIDHFLSILKQETNNEFSIFVDKEKLNPVDWEATRKNSGKADNWNDFSDMILTNSTVNIENDKANKYVSCFNEQNAKKIFLSELEYNSIINLETARACSGFTLLDASDKAVGVVLLDYDLSSDIASVNGYIEKIELVVLGLLLFTLLISVLLSRKSFSVEKKYKDLFNNSLDAILMLSSVDGRFSDGNLASVKLFGLSGPEDLSHLNPSDLSPQYQPDGRLSKDKAKEMIDLAMGKGFNQFEWTHKKLNGQEFLALVSLSRLVNNSNLLQVIVRDITESKNKEELIREKVKESERLINFMSDRELKMVELKGELLRYKNNQNENKN